MIINETLIRVRYAETDKMGVVHHATYPLYYEAGRTELLRDLGLSYREMEDNGFMMPLIDYNVFIRHRPIMTRFLPFVHY